ncbi:ribonuclease H-like domain-containing protein [Syncephalis fuscata]|nr:ribonuclease H-like domain-containing protein [Syncephalis fuscata]
MALIRNASFIAMDCEFTGLGKSQPGTRATNIEDRYVALRKLVDTHALVAVGLSIFIQRPLNGEDDEKIKEIMYDVHVFQLLLCCTQDYMVSPESLRFLVDNGYDLNRLVHDGVPYQPMTVTEIYYFVSWILCTITNKLNTFVADVVEMFPGGIWDTKYTADYIDREPASFLALLYRKCERLNERRRQQQAIELKTTAENTNTVDILISPVLSSNGCAYLYHFKSITKTTNLPQTSVEYCEQYANHGYCPLGRQCPNSHSLDTILDAQERKTKQKRPAIVKMKHQPEQNGNNDIDNDTQSHHESVKRRRRGDSNNNNNQCTCYQPTIDTATNYHAAYFDAYMTGYLHATQRQAQLEQQPNLTESQLRQLMGNRLYLIGKSMPLLVVRSALPQHHLVIALEWPL